MGITICRINIDTFQIELMGNIPESLRMLLNKSKENDYHVKKSELVWALPLEKRSKILKLNPNKHFKLIER
jgi:hypothetical protein